MFIYGESTFWQSIYLGYHEDDKKFWYIYKLRNKDFDCHYYKGVSKDYCYKVYLTEYNNKKNDGFKNFFKVIKDLKLKVHKFDNDCYFMNKESFDKLVVCAKLYGYKPAV